MSTQSGPLVSVVLPMHNGERFVERTLHSALDQDYPNLEVVVVDDGSTDDSRRIIERNAARDRRVRLVTADGKGVAAARNLGVERARGEFIALLDHDDLWFQNKISKQMGRLLQTDDDVALVYAWTLLIDASDRVIGVNRPFDDQTMRAMEGHVLLPLIYRIFLANGSAPVLRRSCLEAVGGWDASIPSLDDWELVLRLAERYRFALVPEFLLAYRQLPGSLSGPGTQWHNEAIAIHTELLTRMRTRHAVVFPALERWSLSGTFAYIGGKCLSAGDIRGGVRLLTRAFVLDPLLILHPGAWKGGLRYVAGILGLKAGRRSEMLDLSAGAAPPVRPRHWPSSIPTPFEWLERRRIRHLRSLELSS